MRRDNRDPTLVAVELRARRQPGESLAQAADRLADAAIPDFGTAEAAAVYAKLNGSLDATNRAFRPHAVP